MNARRAVALIFFALILKGEWVSGMRWAATHSAILPAFSLPACCAAVQAQSLLGLEGFLTSSPSCPAMLAALLMVVRAGHGIDADVLLPVLEVRLFHLPVS